MWLPRLRDREIEALRDFVASRPWTSQGSWSGRCVAPTTLALEFASARISRALSWRLETA